MDTTENIPAADKAAYTKMKRWYRSLPDKKRYLEFVTALLTIPVLLTVLLNNINTIQKKSDDQISATPTVIATPVQRPAAISATPIPTVSLTSSPTPSPDAQCKREIGPVDIVFPEEHDTVSGSPVCLDITRSSGNYCSVVWSYRINGSAWSNYTDRAICMYGLDAGVKNLELRVKSIVSGDEIILKRSFSVAGNPSPTPATSSAQLP